ncbi:cob(I)yrinic acid a,c-diamide adenosyltransferase, partial [Candidatus Bathyarchaeota archaeon]|nr:cob(I)yrinic acid a,c-diamide adenosyltransferase [Candidatus Bathyarchaeota archaeon]
GLGIRANGANNKVFMIQFMKGRRYSELESLDKIKNFEYIQFGRDEFVSKENPAKIDINLAKKGFDYAKKIISKNNYDMLILDELNVAVDFNLITLEEVINLINKKPGKMEIILTGRYAHPELVKIADVVTEMLEIKHPYQTGIMAREGIDF